MIFKAKIFATLVAKNFKILQHLRFTTFVAFFATFVVATFVVFFATFVDFAHSERLTCILTSDPPYLFK